VRIALLSSAPLRSGAATSFAKLAAGLEARGHNVRALAAPDLEAIRRLEPEVILADQPHDAAVAAEAAVPLVYRYNRVQDRRDAGAGERRTATRLAGCIYQSRFVQAEALAHEPWLGSVPAWLVLNGFDTGWFAPGTASSGPEFRVRHRLDARSRIILTVGALTEDKGQEVGIDALGRLRRDGVEVVYVLAGEGPRAPELQSRAAAANVALRSLGWLGAPELREAYRAADLVLHPSDHEIFPNAVGEAMACGCAVVATRVGGTPELVGHDGRAGILVPPRDAAALASAAGALLADAARRADLRGAARARVEAEFPLSRMVEGTERALEAARGGARGSNHHGGSNHHDGRAPDWMHRESPPFTAAE
jgi:glycosyltransferase involved in cell wall biosynthesis